MLLKRKNLLALTRQQSVRSGRRVFRCPTHSPVAIARGLSTTQVHRTDGVFRALTDERVQTPWIVALRKKQAEGEDPTKATSQPALPADRKLEPKRMSDSYHSVVSRSY